MFFLRPFLIALAAFTVLDLVWLGFIARPLYNKYIGHHLREQTDWLAAGLFYVMFLAGIVYFVVLPSAQSSSGQVLLRGALFGLVTYGTYELTNRAVVQNWPWPIVFIDIAWGMFLCAAVGWISWRYSIIV